MPLNFETVTQNSVFILYFVDKIDNLLCTTFLLMCENNGLYQQF